MKYVKVLLSAFAAHSIIACTSVPVAQVAQVDPVAPPCATCAPKPFTAIAVTRPHLCNDYPVTYRVQVPEVDERIRMIDRTELASVATLTYQMPACQR
jgi:hypothetical protein